MKLAAIFFVLGFERAPGGLVRRGRPANTQQRIQPATPAALAGLAPRGRRGRRAVLRQALRLHGADLDGGFKFFPDPTRPGLPGWCVCSIIQGARVAVLYEDIPRAIEARRRSVLAAGWTPVVLSREDVDDPGRRWAAALSIAGLAKNRSAAAA